jgi:isopentenyl-diphosphate delta-isomerase type 1
MEREWVVLVDEENRELGRALKSEVHHGATPLHRAFSLFLFDRAGRTLVQRRARSKPTWPGIWSNSCCGHPAPGEAVLDAVARRCRAELGAEPEGAWLALPDFRYRAEHDGVVENELCPVAVAEVDPAAIAPDPAEVESHSWIAWERLLAELAGRPGAWSPWCAEEARRLEASPGFRAWRAALAG